MFLRFTPLVPIRGFESRAVEHDHRTRPGRRSPDRARTRARFQLEGLEERCLLSGISSISEFPVPVARGLNAITAGPDGNVWFTEESANAIGMINPTTHAISSFTLPTANADPAGITTGPDGNLWFTEYGAHGIGEINPTTHAISSFTLPTANAKPVAIAAGPDGNLWFTEQSARQIGVINPTTHAISEFAAPSAARSPRPPPTAWPPSPSCR